MKRFVTIFLVLISQLAFSQKQFFGVIKPIGGGGCPYVISSFVPSFNLLESPAGVWGPLNYAVDGNAEGYANVSAISGDGYIQSEFGTFLGADSSAYQYTAIFLTANEALASPYYSTCEYGLYVSGFEYYTAVEGVYTPTGVLARSGDIMRVERIGTIVKAKYFRDGIWTDLFSYFSAEFTNLYAGFSSANPGNAVYCRNPKYCN